MKISAARARSRLLPMALGAILLALFLGGCGAGSSSDPIVAMKVNGHGYSLTTYQHLVRALRAIDAYNSGGSPNATDWQTPVGRSNRGAAEQRAVSTLIELEVDREQLRALHIASPQQAIKTDEQQLKNGIAQAVQQSPNDPTIKQVQEAITPDVLALLSEQKADEQALAASPKVTVPSAHLRVIITGSQAEAQQYEQQVQHGTDFATLAKAHSQDAASAAKGGEFGMVFKGEFPQAFDTAFFGQKIPANGKAYAIVPNGGTQWVLCEISQPGTVPVQQVANAQAQTPAFNTWLDQYTSAAHVHTYVTGV